MKLHTLYIGTEFTQHGDRIDPIAQNNLCDMVTNKTNKAFGGCTVTFGHGSYTNDKGQLVKENAMIVATLADDTEKVFELARHAALIFDQESVLVVTPDNEGHFITP